MKQPQFQHFCGSLNYLKEDLYFFLEGKLSKCYFLYKTWQKHPRNHGFQRCSLFFVF